MIKVFKPKSSKEKLFVWSNLEFANNDRILKVFTMMFFGNLPMHSPLIQLELGKTQFNLRVIIYTSLL